MMFRKLLSAISAFLGRILPVREVPLTLPPLHVPDWDSLKAAPKRRATVRAHRVPDAAPPEPDCPPPTGSADDPMRVGTCPLACRTRWSVWVVDGENRRLWSTYVDHRSEAAARAAGERALADLRRGVRPTEP